MIENAKSKIEAMRPHTNKAKMLLLNISVGTLDTEGNSNETLVDELDVTLKEARQVVSSMMAHYSTAAEHQRAANEAIAKSSISTETALGERVLRAVAQGDEQMGAAMEGGTSTHDFLQHLAEQVEEYRKVDRSRIHAGEETRIEIDGCLSLLNSFDKVLDMVQGPQDV